MLTTWLLGGGDVNPLVLILFALLIDVYVGEARFVFRHIPHPVVAIGGLIDWLDRKLNREERSQRDRLVRGFLAALFVTALCAGIGLGASWLTLHHAFGWMVELPLAVTLVAQRSLYDHVHAVGWALQFEGLEGGRREVSMIVGRDVSLLDEHGVARAAIESCAENFGDGVVAPVFWYLVFGMPGLLAYKAVNTMDSMIGHKTPRHVAFGKTAARLDDVLNFIPARLSGLFFVMAALFVPMAKPLSALKVMLRDSHWHRSPNAGWPEGAMAGALGLSLSGPRQYREGPVDEPWIGDGAPTATSADVRRSLYLFVVACLLQAVWVGCIAILLMTTFSEWGA